MWERNSSITFLQFLKNRISWWFHFLVILLISFIVFLFFGLPVEAVLYAALLNTVCISILLIAEYRNTKKRVEKIALYKKMDYIPEHLEKTDEIEEKYEEVIEYLRTGLRRKESKNQKKIKELEDYYRLWTHQIKTPIQALYLLLENREIDSSAVKREVFKIEEYVNTLLAYLYIDSEFSDYVFKNVELDEVLRDSIRKYAPLFIRKKIRIEYEEMDTSFITDEKWLKFIIDQLLSNALKYTKEGIIKIFWKDNSIFIEDTGIGIVEEDLPRIFERGFTGVNGRIDKKSTGIGLSLCKDISKELSIELRVDSKRGQGTSCRLKIQEEQIQNK